MSIALDDVIFLEEEDIRLFNVRSLDAHGGIFVVREPCQLATSTAAPRTAATNGYVTTLAETAAPYAYGLATTQLFGDGNKRTALLAFTSFLDANGYRLALDVDTWERIMLDGANKIVDRDRLGAFIAEEMGRQRGLATPDWCTITS